MGLLRQEGFSQQDFLSHANELVVLSDTGPRAQGTQGRQNLFDTRDLNFRKSAFLV